MEVQVFYEKVGSSYTDIVVRIGTDGRLELDCGYGGPVIKATSGDYDEEWHYSVAPEHKDRLLLELVRAVSAGDAQAGSRFKGWLEAHGIPYDFAYFS